MKIDWKIISDFNDAARQLFDNPFMSDVQFEFTENRKIFAHSFLLSVRSPKFYEPFHSAVSRSIQIPDISYAHFHLFLRHVYTTERIVLTATNIKEISVLASRYEFDKLLTETMSFKKQHRGGQFMFELLDQSLDAEGQVTDKETFHQTIDFISKNTAEMFDHESFLGINARTIKAILDWPILQTYLSEFEIFENFMKCTIFHDKCNCILRATFKSMGINKCFRFPSMTPNQFAKVINFRNSGDCVFFTKEEISDVFLDITIGLDSSSGFNNKKRFNSSTMSSTVVKKPELADIKITTNTTFTNLITVNKNIRIEGILIYEPRGIRRIFITEDITREFVTEFVEHNETEGWNVIEFGIKWFNLHRNKIYNCKIEYEIPEECKTDDNFPDQKSTVKLSKRFFMKQKGPFKMLQLSPNISEIFYTCIQ